MDAEEIRGLPQKHGMYQTVTGGYNFPDGPQNFIAFILVEIAAQLAELNKGLRVLPSRFDKGDPRGLD